MSYHIEQKYQYIGGDRWNWSVWVEATPAALEQVGQVTWFLHHTFPNPVVTKKNREEKFILNRVGWGVFQIRAKLELLDGSHRDLTHQLQLAYPTDRGEAPARGRGVSDEPGRQKVFLSYSQADQGLAAKIREKLAERGFDILDPVNITSGMPVKAAVNKMIRESDLMMGIVTNDLSGPLVLNELTAANKTQKKTIAIINKDLEQEVGIERDQNRVAVDLNSKGAMDTIADILDKMSYE